MTVSILTDTVDFLWMKDKLGAFFLSDNKKQFYISKCVIWQKKMGRNSLHDVSGEKAFADDKMIMKITGR